jgi:hypothetical protein
MLTTTRLALAAAAAMILAACGGSDSSSPPPDGGIQPGTMSTVVGTISGFGSVIVNGVKFDDSSAAVTMDGAVAARDRLRVGMVVQIRGRIRGDGTGTADSIRYEDCVEGPITAMNQVQNTLTVLGQTVHVDDGTVFDGVTLRDMNSFSIGDTVEVSCLPDPVSNRFQATRMERKGTFANGVTEVEVKGPVANLNLAAGTCTIGGLTVNFAGIAAGERPAGLANGMTVEAGGRGYANGVLTADRLRDRDRDRIQTPDGDGVEVEGYVSDFVSITSFKVNGQTVNASNATFRNGTAADILNGVKVEVEGTMVNGILVARVVILKLQTSVRVEAGMQTKDTALSTITLLGRAIKVTAETRLTDRLANASQPAAITLAGLNVGDRLEVLAYKDSSANLVATQIERTAPDQRVVVKGPAEAKQPVTAIKLAGFDIATSASTRYRDQSGSLIDAASFYGLVQTPPALPTMVHAHGVVGSLLVNTVDATRTVATDGELEIDQE